MKNQEKKDSLFETFKNNAIKLESLSEIKGAGKTHCYVKSGTYGDSATLGDVVACDYETPGGYIHRPAMRVR